MLEDKFVLDKEKAREIGRLRRRGSSASEIIEVSRYSGVPVTQEEFDRNATESYEGLTLRNLHVLSEKLIGNNFKNLFCNNVSLSVHGYNLDFSGSYFKNSTWYIAPHHSNFLNTVFENNLFNIVFEKSNFSKSKIINGSVLYSLSLLDCKINGLRTNNDPVIKVDSENFFVRNATPNEHDRCTEATFNYRKNNRDWIKKIRLGLEDEILNAKLSFATDGPKFSIVFDKNYQFGNNKDNFVSSDCFYSIETKYRELFRDAVYFLDDNFLDISNKNIGLRFVRPILNLQE